MRSVRHLVGFLAGWICCSGAGAATPQTGRFVEVQTEHFIVRAPRGAANDVQRKVVQQWGERCEALKRELGAKWFAGYGSNRAGKERGSELDTEVGSGEAHDRDVAANRNRSIDRRDAAGRDDADADKDEVAWSPRCLVVVHGDALSYLRAVPRGERTVASAWVETEAGRVVTRQIDVRGDRADWLDGALAHELVHVLAADRFVRTPMPRWADEGLALLADPHRKQTLHDADFRRASALRRQFRLAELLAMEDYPSPERMTTFYGQSASVVRFLAARGEPTEFVDFVEHALEHGYDAALRKIYDLDGVPELEIEWAKSLRTPSLLAAD
jgi:hypothetical protein